MREEAQKLLGKAGRALHAAETLFCEGDYDVDASFDRQSVHKRIEQAREFLAAATAYLDST